MITAVVVEKRPVAQIVREYGVAPDPDPPRRGVPSPATRPKSSYLRFEAT